MCKNQKKPKVVLDLTADVCPMTFVKTKLMLEELEVGDLLEVTLSGGEPLENVPNSVRNEGHKIISIEQIGDKFKLLIEKVE